MRVAVGVSESVADWGLAVFLNRPNLLQICFGLSVVVVGLDLVLAVLVLHVVGVNGVAVGLSMIAVFVGCGLAVVCVFLLLNRPNRLHICFMLLLSGG